MIEIESKYKIYEKKFGYVNWIGFWTLYKKEVLRFLKVVIRIVFNHFPIEIHVIPLRVFTAMYHFFS